MEGKKDTICAVVVTYNRKNLLMECLEALRNQTRPLQGIYLIDNASTDETPQLLFERSYIQKLPLENLKGPWEETFYIDVPSEDKIPLHYVRMHENTGGAGGFHEGIKRGYERGYDWLWLMDDDTIPNNNALLELLRIKDFIPIEKIGFVSSKALWIDGTPHLMNVPQVKPLIDFTPFNKYEEEGFLYVKAASFVSLLFRIFVIEKVGYPIKEFFLWGDDIEFTERISAHFMGFYCNKSIAIHKTQENYSAINTYDWRLYYLIRNNLYLAKRDSIVRFLYNLFKNFFETFNLPPKWWKIKLKACIDVLFFNPKIIYPQKSNKNASSNI